MKHPKIRKQLPDGSSIMVEWWDFWTGETNRIGQYVKYNKNNRGVTPKFNPKMESKNE